MPITRPAYRRIIPKVLKQGRAMRGKFLSLHRLPGRQTSLSIIVSKKITNKAVARNRTRRVIFAALHPLLSSLGAPEHLVVLAKQVIDTPEKSQAAQAEAVSLFTSHATD